VFITVNKADKEETRKKSKIEDRKERERAKRD
jgi:hypothetical protein